MNQNHQNLLVTVEAELFALSMVTAYNEMWYAVVQSSQGTSLPTKTIPTYLPTYLPDKASIKKWNILDE